MKNQKSKTAVFALPCLALPILSQAAQVTWASDDDNQFCRVNFSGASKLQHP